MFAAAPSLSPSGIARTRIRFRRCLFPETGKSLGPLLALVSTKACDNFLQNNLLPDKLVRQLPDILKTTAIRNVAFGR